MQMDKNLTQFNQLSILVVDDYIVNQEMTKEMLEMMGCQVDVAENGREAVDMQSSNHYDVIFMDIQMPQMDGVMALEEIRKEEVNQKHPCVIALTANALSGDKEKYLAAGFDDYMSKPVKIKDLEKVLKKHFSSL